MNTIFSSAALVLEHVKNYSNNTKKYGNYPNLSPLKQDTVSFSASKTKNSDKSTENKTGWEIIRGEKNDPDNIEKNSVKLMRLIQKNKNWEDAMSYDCAEAYLKQGDFHLYLENGKPKSAVQFEGDTVQLILGEKRNGIPDLKYLSVIKEHTKDYKMNEYKKAMLDTVDDADEFKKRLGKPINEASSEDILYTAGMLEKRDEKDGLLILSSFGQPNHNEKNLYKYLSWELLGIDENELLKDVKEIKGDAFFSHNVKTAGKIEHIGGRAFFPTENDFDFGNLKSIGGDAYMEGYNTETCGNLQSVGGTCYISKGNDKLKQELNLKGIKTYENECYW